MSAAAEKLHAWYSFHETKRNGARVHRADDGGEVPVTHTKVGYDPYGLPVDAVYVGLVGELLREINCGLFFHERFTRHNTDPYPDPPTPRPLPVVPDAEFAQALDVLWTPNALKGIFASEWDNYAEALPPTLKNISGAQVIEYVSRALDHYRATRP